MDDDHRPGGRYGPPDETSMFIGNLPVILPLAFLVIITLGYISIKYVLSNKGVESSYFDDQPGVVARKGDRLGKTASHTA